MLDVYAVLRSARGESGRAGMPEAGGPMAPGLLAGARCGPFWPLASALGARGQRTLAAFHSTCGGAEAFHWSHSGDISRSTAGLARGARACHLAVKGSKSHLRWMSYSYGTWGAGTTC